MYNQVMHKLYIVEVANRIGRKFEEWEPLCEEHLTSDEVAELFEDCKNDTGVRYRARLLPQFGYEVITPDSLRAMIDEEEPGLSRDLPASVHRMNDLILTAMGI
jgi:hypothetical protein